MHQVKALKLGQEALAERLSQEEEHRTAAEGEVARQKACIGKLRAEVAESEDTLQSAKAKVGTKIMQYLLLMHLSTSIWPTFLLS